MFHFSSSSFSCCVFSPREERLFELGWNDNCYFHGNSETYMTLPSSVSQQHKEANTNPHYFMNRFRGDEGAAGQLACSGMSNAAASNAVSTEDLEEDFSPEDFDRFAHYQQHYRRQHESSSCSGGASSEEDSYLPRGVPPAILDLPEILRKSAVFNETATATGSLVPPSFLFRNTHDARFLQSLEDRRAAFRNKLLSQAIDYIVPSGNDLAKWSYGRFGFAHNERDRTLTILECFPALRAIGISETAAEFAELRAREEANATKRTSSRRRTTRSSTNSQARGGRASFYRHHYFDKISIALRRDETDRSSSEVAALFARDGLVYDAIKK